MPIDKEQLQTWNRLLESNQDALSQKLTDLELSALYSWASDCFRGFEKTVTLLKEIKSSSGDRDLIHDHVVDIFWQLDHIKRHILDAEKGFSVLMNLLSENAEKEKKG